MAAHGVAVDAGEARLQAPTVSRHPLGEAPAVAQATPEASPELVLLTDGEGAVAVAEPRSGPDGMRLQAGHRLSGLRPPRLPAP